MRACHRIRVRTAQSAQRAGVPSELPSLRAPRPQFLADGALAIGEEAAGLAIRQPWSADPERKGARPADLTRGPGHRVTVIEGKRRNPLEPHLEGDPELHPRQVRPHAAVDAQAEGGMAV